MTSWIKVKIKNKEIIAMAGGYTGKTEKLEPLGDILTMNRLWITKTDSKDLRLKLGQIVKVKIGDKYYTGKVVKWSRGSRQIIFIKSPKISKTVAKRIRADLI